MGRLSRCRMPRTVGARYPGSRLLGQQRAHGDGHRGGTRQGADRSRRKGGYLLARVRPERQAGRDRAAVARPSGGRPHGERDAHRGKDGRPGAACGCGRSAAAGVGAGHAARLPLPHHRVVLGGVDPPRGPAMPRLHALLSGRGRSTLGHRVLLRGPRRHLPKAGRRDQSLPRRT